MSKRFSKTEKQNKTLATDEILGKMNKQAFRDGILIETMVNLKKEQSLTVLFIS